MNIKHGAAVDGAIGTIAFVVLYEVFQRTVNGHVPTPEERIFACISGGFAGGWVGSEIRDKKSKPNGPS